MPGVAGAARPARARGKRDCSRHHSSGSSLAARAEKNRQTPDSCLALARQRPVPGTMLANRRSYRSLAATLGRPSQVSYFLLLLSLLSSYFLLLEKEKK